MYSGSSTMRPFSNLNGCAILPVRPVENNYLQVFEHTH